MKKNVILILLPVLILCVLASRAGWAREKESSMKKNSILFLLLVLILCVLGIVLLITRNTPESPASEVEALPAEIVDLDTFYRMPITKDYTDLRELPVDYSTEQAQLDRCFVIGAMVHNDDLYAEFMERCGQNEDAFIRVVQTTIEGDPILFDVLHDSRTDHIYIVFDASRDDFSAEEDRVIRLMEYEHTAEHEIDGREYWIAYNGAIEDVQLEREDVFVLAFIN